MSTQEVKRKLVAILSADVKGYSRLMREDKVGSIRTLNIYKETISNLVQNYHARVVDVPGDNVLAEFASVVLYDLTSDAIPAILSLNLTEYLEVKEE